MPIHINTQEKDFLFALVKEALRLATTAKRKLTEQDIQQVLSTDFAPFCQEENNLLTGNLKEKMGAFVSYFMQNTCATQKQVPEKMLRGCIGMMRGQFPLWLTISNMAYSAACEDTRFSPIQEEELPYITYDITILEPMSICHDTSKIELGKHGIMLQAKGRHAVFLPHVPTEQGWSLEQTFDQLCHKAGLAKNTWQENDTVFYWFEGLLLHP